MVYRHTDPRRPALGLSWEDLELGLMEGPVHAAEKNMEELGKIMVWALRRRLGKTVKTWARS